MTSSADGIVSDKYGDCYQDIEGQKEKYKEGSDQKSWETLLARIDGRRSS